MCWVQTLLGHQVNTWKKTRRNLDRKLVCNGEQMSWVSERERGHRDQGNRRRARHTHTQLVHIHTLRVLYAWQA